MQEQQHQQQGKEGERQGRRQQQDQYKQRVGRQHHSPLVMLLVAVQGLQLAVQVLLYLQQQQQYNQQ
jgi:hypothetical protein